MERKSKSLPLTLKPTTTLVIQPHTEARQRQVPRSEQQQTGRAFAKKDILTEQQNNKTDLDIEKTPQSSYYFFQTHISFFESFKGHILYKKSEGVMSREIVRLHPQITSNLNSLIRFKCADIIFTHESSVT